MMYFNIECGNVLTYDEMVEEAKELYDLDDPTNALSYEEYYEEFDEDEDPYVDDFDEVGFNPYMGCYDYDC